MVFSPKKEKKFLEEGWRSNNIILPYWIFQYKDEMSDFLKVLVVLTGGLKDGDLKKCIISKNLKCILIVFNSPNILVSPVVVSSLQGDFEDKIQTTAHKRAISIDRKKNGGELLCSMDIELPFEVEPEFQSKDGVKGCEVVVLRDKQVVLIMRLKRNRMDLLVEDMNRMHIRSHNSKFRFWSLWSFIGVFFLVIILEIYLFLLSYLPVSA